jgi:hypothetical protein
VIISIVVSLALILAATLWPQPAGISGATSPRCLWCSESSVADAVANFILFVPLGATLGWRWSNRNPMARVLATALVLSTMLEAIQFADVVNGRHASLLDIACNTFGALAGALIAMGIPSLVRATPETSRRLFLLYGVGLQVVLLVLGWALQRPPSVAEVVAPVRSALPAPTGFGWFSQRILWAELDGTRFEQRGTGPMLVTHAVQREQQLRVAVIGRDSRRTFVPLVFVHDANNRSLHTSIGQYGEDYALRVAVAAGRLGLHMPPIVVRSIMHPRGAASAAPSTDSIPIEIEAIVSSARWHLASHSADVRSDSIDLIVRPALAWMLFVPLRDANGAVALMGTAAFVSILSIPLLVLVARAFRSDMIGLACGVAVSGVAFGVASILTSLSMPTATDFLSLLATALVTALARRAFRRI